MSSLYEAPITVPGSQLFTKMNESLAKLYSECLLDDLMALSLEEGSGVHEKLGIKNKDFLESIACS